MYFLLIRCRCISVVHLRLSVSFLISLLISRLSPRGRPLDLQELPGGRGQDTAELPDDDWGLPTIIVIKAVNTALNMSNLSPSGVVSRVTMWGLGLAHSKGKRNTSPAFEWASRWKLLWCWPGFGLVLLLIYFELLRGQGCVESKNMTK